MTVSEQQLHLEHQITKAIDEFPFSTETIDYDSLPKQIIDQMTAEKQKILNSLFQLYVLYSDATQKN